MPTYTTFSQAWLEDPVALRNIFVVVNVLYDSTGTGTSYVSTPLYFSSAGYITSDGLISFSPILSNSFSISEAITYDGGVTMTYSDISLYNQNGEIDVYLDSNTYVWANQSIKIYLGDPSWSTTSANYSTTFKLVFDGVINDIDSKSRAELNIKLRDKQERLNSPITENKLGVYGTWVNTAQNADNIKPLVFGEVFNMTPLLMDPNNGGGQYMVNDGAVAEIIEVRDNGVPIYQNGSSVYTGATVNTTTGTFILTYPPAGAITASVRGINNGINFTTGATTGTYSNTVAKLIALIATQYGKANSRLTAADLDLPSLLAFDTANTQPVGYVVTDRENVLNVCSSIAGSIGAQIFFTREGKLQLLKYGVGVTPAQDANITVGVTAPVTDSDILYNSLDISEKLPFLGAVKLGYCKNWTPQPGLVTAIPADHKDLFAEEWLTITSTASGTLVSNYKLDIDPPQKDTMLLVQNDADAEATRLVTYYSIQRYKYKFSGVPKLLALRLGQQVYLSHNRFNLYNAGAGKLGQVVSISPNWTEATVDVEVLI